VLHTYANPDGTQRIEDTRPLTKKRMETVDKEFLDASLLLLAIPLDCGRVLLTVPPPMVRGDDTCIR
jgi:hypothetical protein